MRTEGETVFVRWYQKVLQGIVVRENDMMGMTAVLIPLQGHHVTALFTPGHVYDTADEAGNSESVPKSAESVPDIPKDVPETFQRRSENVPKYAETGMCEAFRKAHWDAVRNCLRTDSLDEFYSLWKMEHTPFGHTEAQAKEPAAEIGTKPCTKAAPMRRAETIQLSLFD